MILKHFKSVQNFVRILLLFWWVLTACQSETIAPETPIFRLKVPENLADSVPFPAHNPTSEAGIELGRMLFYDPVLSANNQVSCASCHVQNQGFADGVALSKHGVSGQKLKRHSPILINLAWNRGLFWDGGANNLESLAFAPLTHPDEMALNLDEIPSKLQNRFDYSARFREVFGTNEIHSSLVARALAQFQRSLISANSRYDKFIRTENNTQFSDLEKVGLQIFRQKCSSCHAGDFFTDFGFHNNGLDDNFPMDFENPWQGRYRVTLNPEDLGKYKTPTLRNITKTAPYMHDGRFKTLDEVLNHYASEIMDFETLASELRDENGQPKKLISEDEKIALLAFLETLTDEDFLQNSKFSKPKIFE